MNFGFGALHSAWRFTQSVSHAAAPEKASSDEVSLIISRLDNIFRRDLFRSSICSVSSSGLSVVIQNKQSLR